MAMFKEKNTCCVLVSTARGLDILEGRWPISKRPSKRKIALQDSSKVTVAAFILLSFGVVYVFGTLATVGWRPLAIHGVLVVISPAWVLFYLFGAILVSRVKQGLSWWNVVCGNLMLADDRVDVYIWDEGNSLGDYGNPRHLLSWFVIGMSLMSWVSGIHSNNYFRNSSQNSDCGHLSWKILKTVKVFDRRLWNRRNEEGKSIARRLRFTCHIPLPVGAGRNVSMIIAPKAARPWTTVLKANEFDVPAKTFEGTFDQYISRNGEELMFATNRSLLL